VNSKDNLRDDSHRSGHETIRVVLEGGPADLPSEMRLHQAVLANRKVKLPRYGGYEHFELVDSDRQETGASPVFRWTMRTKVAE
jgi:Family of unknown function (DUF5988)